MIPSNIKQAVRLIRCFLNLKRISVSPIKGFVSFHIHFWPSAHSINMKAITNNTQIEMFVFNLTNNKLFWFCLWYKLLLVVFFLILWCKTSSIQGRLPACYVTMSGILNAWSSRPCRPPVVISSLCHQAWQCVLFTETWASMFLLYELHSQF